MTPHVDPAIYKSMQAFVERYRSELSRISENMQKQAEEFFASLPKPGLSEDDLLDLPYGATVVDKDASTWTKFEDDEFRRGGVWRMRNGAVLSAPSLVSIYGPLTGPHTETTGLTFSDLDQLPQGAVIRSGLGKRLTKVAARRWAPDDYPDGILHQNTLVSGGYDPLTLISEPKPEQAPLPGGQVLDRDRWLWTAASTPTGRLKWSSLRTNRTLSTYELTNAHGPFAYAIPLTAEDLDAFPTGTTVFTDVRSTTFESETWTKLSTGLWRDGSIPIHLPAHSLTNRGVYFGSLPEPTVEALSETQLSALPKGAKVQRVHGKQDIFTKTGPNMFHHVNHGTYFSTTNLYNSFAPLTRIEESKRPHDLRPGSVIRGALPAGGRWFLTSKGGVRTWIPQTTTATRTDDDFGTFTILLEAP